METYPTNQSPYTSRVEASAPAADPKTRVVEVPALEGPDTLTFITSKGEQIVVPWVEETLTYEQASAFQDTPNGELEMAMFIFKEILPPKIGEKVRALNLRELQIFLSAWMDGRDGEVGAGES